MPIPMRSGARDMRSNSSPVGSVVVTVLSS
jgi:hypothetical protein